MLTKAYLVTVFFVIAGTCPSVRAEEQLPPFPQCTAQCPAQFGSARCHAVCRPGQVATCRPETDAREAWVDSEGKRCTRVIYQSGGWHYLDDLGTSCRRATFGTCTPICSCR